MDTPKKSLGQHWLNDQESLKAIVRLAHVTKEDTILEIGPGPGSLTRLLAAQARHVVAVELDRDLAYVLKARVDADNVEVVEQDILTFDLRRLPTGYKVVANIPYYLTSKLIRTLLEAPNRPTIVVLLIQKEVAERLTAKPGSLSILGVSAQFYADVELGPIVPAGLFKPPPEVDSQVVALRLREAPLFSDITPKEYFRVVRAGFSEKRKKLRSSLSGGLAISKDQADRLLESAHIRPDARAQELTLEEWAGLTREFKNPAI
ncbi:MAG TPA: 16S rRNA (adenine(1518)-N(6)/adenine(1519)-N(6))-dimethyltransferase RsmA [Candidatus Saccharimonadales bacterium]|nr:16S rRNA (adenine(1518)-N(6)/adenine(1519)-N(6))-dimethyltransferase RsmA [Candidatus Saccharimonadales bacterium]